MAKYTINYTCGHTETIQLTGKVSDRIRRIERMEQSECPSCLRSKQNAQAQQASEDRGLVELEGTPKQVAWATTIRENVCKALDKVRKIASNDQAKAMIEKWERGINSKTDAAWWIDNRYNLSSDMMPEQAIITTFIHNF